MADKVVPFLWYNEHAEAAAEFYCGLIPDSRITRVTRMPADSPSGPAGSVVVVDFVLAGRAFVAMTAGGADGFNHAVSLVLRCESQAEVDRLWEGLLAGGGQPQACGWLRDRYGLCWQIVPTVMFEMMASPDRAAARRASEAMMTMVKFDIANLEAAFRG